MVAAPLLLAVCLGASYVVSEADDISTDNAFIRLVAVPTGHNLYAASPSQGEDRALHGDLLGGAWRVEKLSGPSDPQLKVMLWNFRTGKYLHVRSQYPMSGDPVYLQSSTSEGSQWLVDFVGSTTVRLRNVRSSNYLTAVDHQIMGTPARQTSTVLSGSDWTVDVFDSAQVVESAASQAVDDSAVEAVCPSGHWLHDCVADELGDGLAVSADGRRCTATSDGAAPIRAKALCSQAQTWSSNSGLYAEGTIAAACAGSRVALSCTCMTAWGASSVCNSLTSFAPSGGRCSKYVTPGTVSHRRRGSGAVGARVYAICGEVSDALRSCSDGDVKLGASGGPGWTAIQVRGWNAALPANGYGGITAVFAKEQIWHTEFFRLEWPIVRLEGSNHDGVWSLHAGCGNRNGHATCDAICKSLDSPGPVSGWDVPCGSGYPSGAELRATNCIFKYGPNTSSASDWYGEVFGTTDSCANPMMHCQCQGPPPATPSTASVCTGSCGNAGGWSVGLHGNGYGGISRVYYQAFIQDSTQFQLDWPIVSLEGSNSDGMWSLHGGCGNRNGQAACDAICKALSSPGRVASWDVPCGNGYPSGAEAVAPSCTFKRGPTSEGALNWYGEAFGDTQSCNNPMNNCQCIGRLADPPSSTCGGACDNMAGREYQAYIHHGGGWHPICGHFWWLNNHGADTFCQKLGFTSGTVARDDYVTLYRDAMKLGICQAGEALDACTGGQNEFGVLPASSTGTQGCAAGDADLTGVLVTCYGPTGLSRQQSCREGPRLAARQADDATTTTPVAVATQAPVSNVATASGPTEEDSESSSTGTYVGLAFGWIAFTVGSCFAWRWRNRCRRKLAVVLPLGGDVEEDDKMSEDSVKTTDSVADTTFPEHWTNKSAGFDQMVYVSTPMTGNFNEVMVDSYVARATRDRGCPKAADPCAPTPGGCPCVQPGGNPGLPTKLVVRRVVRVEDSKLWEKYVAKRQAIKANRRYDEVRQFSPPLLTSAFADRHAEDLGSLDKELNECFLFHGTDVRAALSIGQDNFKLSFAGNNVGTMYGEGAYLAESCIKADEYTTDEPGGYYDGVFAMLMFRVCMGKMFYTTRRDEEAGKNTLEKGTHDSTLGDRIAGAGTFREMVVYDGAQLYPEYIIFYSRVFAADPDDFATRLTALQYQLQVPVYWSNCHKNPAIEDFDAQVKVRKEMVRVIQSLCSACTEGRNPTVHEVHRFEDSKMWMQYLDKKMAFSQELDNINCQETKVCQALKRLAEESMISTANLAEELNEFLLWHGTLKEYAEKISADGFIIGSARCGRRFGNGVYLAEQLDKSLGYAQADGNGFKYVLLCRAVCGKLYVTRQNWEDEADQAAKKQGCNCVLAEPSGQAREFIVHEAAQIYPEFVVKLRH